MIKAKLIRARLPDNYDPPGDYRWIVEVAPTSLPFKEYVVKIKHFMDTAGISSYCNHGLRIGFMSYDDAMLFLISH